VCLEAGLAPRYRQVDLLGKRVLDDDTDFRAVSPSGCVPALALDDGTRLNEMSAVTMYLADQAPSSGLAPRPGDPARYRLQQWLSFVGTEIHKTFVFPTYRLQGTPEPVKAHARALLEPALAVLDRRFREAPHLVGESFTVADAYLAWTLALIRRAGVDVAPWRALAAYADRIRGRPSVHDAFATERAIAGL
jgi:glutathione S-transferase